MGRPTFTVINGGGQYEKKEKPLFLIIQGGPPMPFTFTFEEAANQAAEEARSKILTCSELGPVSRYPVLSLFRKVDEEVTKVRDCLKNMYLELSDKDEKGNPITEKVAIGLGTDGKPIFQDQYKLSGDNKKKAEEETNKTKKIEITLEANKIPLSYLNNAKLSPMDLFSIDFLINPDK